MNILKSFFAGSVICSSLLAFADAPELIERVVKEMRDSGADVQAGFDAELGVWAVGIGSTPIEGNIDMDKAREMSLVEAKNAIAEYLGAQISTATQKSTEESLKGETAESKEFYQKVQKVEVDQFLKGLNMLTARRNGDGEMVVTVYAVAKIEDKGGALESAKNKYGNANTVEATGYGPDAETATQRALRSAVEQVIGTSSVSKTIVNTMEQSVNDQVTSAQSIKSRKGTYANGLVKEYRFKQDPVKRAEGFKAVVIATVCKAEVLDNYRAYMKAMDKPSFYLVSGDEELVDSFTQYFIDKGFDISNKPEKANFAITLKGRFAEVKDPVDGSEGTQLSLTVSVMTIDGVKVLLKIQNDARKACSFTGDADRQRELCAKKAAKQIESLLSKKIHGMIAKMMDEIE